MEGASAISPPHLDLRIGKIPATSSRILYDIPCKVCQDHSSGKHYGIFACDGCAGFFKRSIRRSRQYVCKAKSEGSCVVDKTHRNQCRACRLRKCVEAGMNKDAVQHERGPRNSTIRRQMALYFKESCDPSSEVGCGTSATAVLPQAHVLDLAQPKVGSPSSTSPEPSGHFIPSAAAFIYAQALLPKVRLDSLPGQIVYLKHLRFGVGGGMILDKRSFLFPVKSNLFTPSLSIPAPFPFNSIEAVCESAARILFMNVKWAKSVPVFTKLNYKDQLLLLEESWRELFVLSAGQFMFPLELVQLLLAQITSMTETEKAETLAKEVKLFQETLIKFKQLHVDLHEYACLRAIVLFKTSFESSSSSSNPSSSSERKCLRDVAEIAALQDQTQLTLNKYISTAHPTQPFRFGKLLLLLPSLRLISNKTIEELFFRRTIGNIPIERIICDMYKSNN